MLHTFPLPSSIDNAKKGTKYKSFRTGHKHDDRRQFAAVKTW